MKRDILKSLFAIIFTVILGATFASCGGSSDEPDAPKPTVPLTIVNQSIAEGSTVATEVTQLTVEYSHPIALDASKKITLNGSALTAKTSNKTLTVDFSLVEGTQYTLSIPAGAVVRKDDTTVKASALSLTFKTPDPITLGDIDPLCNPNATEATKKVYQFLIDNYGKKTLSGAMANVANNNEFSDLIYTTTGRHPALTGYDFIHIHYAPANWINYSDINPAKTQWENNGLVSYMWHWNVPTYEGCPIEKYSATANNGFDIRNALKEGTWENKFILEDIKEVASYLKLLQDAGIPVIWRPLHEADGNYTKYNKDNGAWFWWGDKGAEYTKQLWKLLYDKLVNEYKLNNLIWVWTIQVSEGFESAAAESYPGDEYVDIVGVDIYSDNTRAKTTEFDFMNKVTRGKKLTTVSECGNIPDPAKNMTAGAYWSWFMTWYCLENGNLMLNFPNDDNYKLNTASYWKEVIRSSYVLNREDMPSLK